MCDIRQRKTVWVGCATEKSTNDGLQLFNGTSNTNPLPITVIYG